MVWQWREDPRQRTWRTVGLLFLAFYFLEALLFWGPNPLLVPPRFTPLVFWGLFGVALIVVVTRPVRGTAPLDRLEQRQSWLLGGAITLSVVGCTCLVIMRTHDITLGHAVLLFTLAQAAFVIGALQFNAGWLAAGLLWVAGGALIIWRPAGQDYLLGAVIAAGFLAIGTWRRCAVQLASPADVSSTPAPSASAERVH